MRILQFIYAAMLASEVAYIRNEKNGLQWSLPSEDTGSEEPPAEIE
jgi:hypothetical protein